MQLDIFQNRKKEMMIALIKYENSRLRRKMRKTNDKIYFFSIPCPCPISVKPGFCINFT